jgi:tetraprenyl-beta-curcumene synthase
MRTLRIPRARDTVALITTGATFWLTIAPRARRELRHWTRYAKSTPDPILRTHALGKLSSEGLNPEAAAFFTVLAPKANRPRLIELIVAYQAMYDYLDSVNEDLAFSPLSDGLRLHRALVHTMQPTPSPIDYYAHHSQHDDGGYLNTLITACRTIMDALPSTPIVYRLLIDAAERCGEAQARNHAVLVEGHDQLISWSEAQAPDSGYLWWELAAGGISCLAIHALFAAAATPNMTPGEAGRVDAAYFPPVCAISALLDSLIDHPHDAGTTNHSFAAHYPSNALAAQRYATIITGAEGLMGGLRHQRRHRIILAGITGYYLSAPEAASEFARPVSARTIDAAGPMTGLILAVMRARRRRHSTTLSRG